MNNTPLITDVTNAHRTWCRFTALVRKLAAAEPLWQFYGERVVGGQVDTVLRPTGADLFNDALLYAQKEDYEMLRPDLKRIEVELQKFWRFPENVDELVEQLDICEQLVARALRQSANQPRI